MVRYPQRFLGRDLAPMRAFIAESAAADDAARARVAAQEARTRRMERMLFRGAIAATVVMAILAVGAGVAAWLAVKSEQHASRNFELTVSQADALVTKLSTELKDRVGISQDGIRRILALIESRFAELAAADASSPRLALSRANMLSAFAENYIELGDLQQARNRAQECVDIARPLQGNGAITLAAARGLARCLETLASALAVRSDIKAALPAYEESIALRRRILAADPASTASQLELGHTLAYYAYALINNRSIDQALVPAQESLSITKALATQDRNNAAWMREYIESLNMTAMAQHAKK